MKFEIKNNLKQICKLKIISSFKFVYTAYTRI